MKSLADCSVDSVVTDPPYELGFMGKSWDRKGIAYDVAVWSECLRVLKPGGHLLAFGGSRTYHRLACAIEDAGFEIRDQIQWLYGSGFPKSLDVSKAIDKQRDDDEARQAVGSWLRLQRERRGLAQKEVAAHWPSRTGGLTGCVANWELGLNLPTWHQWLKLKEIIGFDCGVDAEVWRLNGRKGQPGEGWESREVIGLHTAPAKAIFGGPELPQQVLVTSPTSAASSQWNGWGTALKPAHEPIVVARKPLDGTVAENVLKWGTGGINVDGCRVGEGGQAQWAKPRGAGYCGGYADNGDQPQLENPQGRWPANVIHDGSDEVLALFPETESGSGVKNPIGGISMWSRGSNWRDSGEYEASSGSAARFFYCAKADKEDREEGCEHLDLRIADQSHKRPRTELDDPRRAGVTPRKNHHPTVKPTSLMRYLCRLVTPPNGLVLDPFCGSGSTGKAAMFEGLRFIGIDLEPEYVELAQLRIEAATKQGQLLFEATA